MSTSAARNPSAATQVRKIVEEVLRVANSAHASAVVSGGGKPHVRITKQVTDFEDTYFRAMLTGIEYATHGHFDSGRDSFGAKESMLRSRHVDVTVRAVKGLG